MHTQTHTHTRAHWYWGIQFLSWVHSSFVSRTVIQLVCDADKRFWLLMCTFFGTFEAGMLVCLYSQLFKQMKNQKCLTFEKQHRVKISADTFNLLHFICFFSVLSSVRNTETFITLWFATINGKKKSVHNPPKCELATESTVVKLQCWKKNSIWTEIKWKINACTTLKRTYQ